MRNRMHPQSHLEREGVLSEEEEEEEQESTRVPVHLLQSGDGQTLRMTLVEMTSKKEQRILFQTWSCPVDSRRPKSGQTAFLVGTSRAERRRQWRVRSTRSSRWGNRQKWVHYSVDPVVSVAMREGG